MVSGTCVWALLSYTLVNGHTLDSSTALWHHPAASAAESTSKTPVEPFGTRKRNFSKQPLHNATTSHPNLSLVARPRFRDLGRPHAGDTVVPSRVPPRGFSPGCSYQSFCHSRIFRARRANPCTTLSIKPPRRDRSHLSTNATCSVPAPSFILFRTRHERAA